MFMPSLKWPLWMTPRAAVAENLDQFEASASHSRFSRRNVSDVVPACMNAFCSVSAVWYMDERASRES